MNNKSKNLKQQIFYPFTIIIIIMIIILTISLYANYINKSYTVIYDNISDNLEDSDYTIYYMTSTINNVISQLLINTRVRNIMYSTGNHSALDIYNCQKTLASYSLSSSVINSIYIYNNNLEQFLTSYSNLGLIDEDAFFDTDITERLNSDTIIKKLDPIPREIDVQISPFLNIQTQNLFSYVYYDSLTEGKINEAIIINVNQSYMTDLLDEMNEGSSNSKYIIDTKGNLVLKDTANETSSVLTESLINDKILSSKDEKGYFVIEHGRSKYHISFQKMTIPDWILINETSLKSISMGFNDVLITSIIICFVLLILSVILTTIISNWKYKPIEKVVDDLHTLENEHLKNSFRIKQNYLRDLITNNTYSKNNSGDHELHQLNISLSERIGLILVQYDNYLDYLNTTDIKERKSDAIEMVKLVSEAFSTNYSNEVFFTKDDTMAIIFNAPSTLDVKALINDCSKMQNILLKSSGRSFSITVGPIAEDTSDINYYYQETLKASKLRLVMGRGKVIEYSELIDYEEQDTESSIYYHKKIIEALLSGNKMDTLSSHSKLVHHLKTGSPVNVAFSYTRLSFLVYESVYHLINDSQDEEFSLNKVMKTINSIETIQDLKVFFEKWFLYILNKQENINKNRHIDLMEKIKLYISESYSDINLSQSMIADKFNISNAYLGRLFRQLNNLSIAAYINNIRLEQAKIILLETDLSISDIANKIGIINSNYFYSMFKKRFGVTPSTYRSKNKINN